MEAAEAKNSRLALYWSRLEISPILIKELGRIGRIRFSSPGGEQREIILTARFYRAMFRAMPFDGRRETVFETLPEILSLEYGSSSWADGISLGQYRLIARDSVRVFWKMYDLVEHRDLSRARSSFGIKRLAMG